MVLKSKDSKVISQSVVSRLFAALISFNPFAQKTEEKLLLTEFEYTDSDNDGIYTAKIQAPAVGGEYEIITVMDFKDPNLATKEIKLITVVDPEGYIYEKYGNREIRIPDAKVTLYWMNPENNQYEVWPSEKYSQENPQVTDVRGTYSFLVPEGNYMVKVEASGYLSYQGEAFEVKSGVGIHKNIELKVGYWWLKGIDWKIILIVILVILTTVFSTLLLYNFYRDKIK